MNELTPQQRMLKAYCDDNDMDQMGILLKQYNPFIFGLCMKFLKDRHRAEDATGDIILKLLETICKYKIKHFQFWLYKVVRNECFKHSKTNLPHLPEDFLNYYINEFVENGEDSNLYYTEEIFTALTKCIEKLKPDQKRCFVDFYFNEKSYKDIAAKRGFDLKKVKSHLQNGMRNVKICVLKSIKNDH